jgi:aryl-alcohol dehydrogenase-like predicted oxidoreductase
LQPLYNLLDRSIEWELLPVCRAEGVGVIPWSPLRGGWLSGKYRRGMSAPPAGTRIEDAEKQGWGERWSEYATERTWNVIDALLAIAEELGKTPAQTALNWLLAQPLITAPILGVRTMAHLEDNLGAAGWALSGEQLDRLNRASDIQPPYPYHF